VSFFNRPPRQAFGSKYLASAQINKCAQNIKGLPQKWNQIEAELTQAEVASSHNLFNPTLRNGTELKGKPVITPNYELDNLMKAMCTDSSVRWQFRRGHNHITHPTCWADIPPNRGHATCARTKFNQLETQEQRRLAGPPPIRPG